MTIRLTLPLPPNIANGRMHWRTKDRKRQAYMTHCYIFGMDTRPAVLNAAGKPELPFPKALIAVKVYLVQKMDADNLMARLKWPIDWLVSDGWIADDGPDYLEWVGMPTQAIDRKAPRVEIELEAA